MAQVYEPAAADGSGHGCDAPGTFVGLRNDLD
jgi:hypothetical protein